MRESSDRDSCELQLLFQKRGLRAMTEPPQPSVPPRADHTILLCAYTLNVEGDLSARTHTRRCNEKLHTPSQQYVLYPHQTHPSSCVLSNDCLSSIYRIFGLLTVCLKIRSTCCINVVCVLRKNNHYSEHTCHVSCVIYLAGSCWFF